MTDPQYGYTPPGGQPTTPTPPAAPTDPNLIVELNSGARASVMTLEEAEWFNRSCSQYLTETRFTENTDLQDLDRLLGLELLLFRWTKWQMSGVDYDTNLVNDAELRRNIKDQSEAINKLKEQMGLSKKSRDSKASSVEDRWANLMARAKEFGVHRENQLTVALRLMNELSAIVGSYDRADAEERRKLGFETPEEILAWVRDVMLPEYIEVDKHFRDNVQRYWKQGA